MGNKISYASSRRGHAAAMKHSAWSRKPGRVDYSGATRSRDTQVVPHPMRGLGTGFRRSSRPAVRAAAKGLFPDVVDGTRRTREG